MPYHSSLVLAEVTNGDAATRGCGASLSRVNLWEDERKLPMEIAQPSKLLAEIPRKSRIHEEFTARSDDPGTPTYDRHEEG